MQSYKFYCILISHDDATEKTDDIVNKFLYQATPFKNKYLIKPYDIRTHIHAHRPTLIWGSIISM